MTKITARELRHRIKLCSGSDVVLGTDIVLVREDVLETWAKIEPKTTSMFSRAGYNVLESRERQTHLITIRMRRDIDVTASAWVYEERLQSGARWFKILGIKEAYENGEFLVMSARLIERGEDLASPVDSATEEQEAIKVVSHGVVL